MEEELNQLSGSPEADSTNEPQDRPGKGIFEWLQMLLGCLLTAVVIFNCVARLNQVVGHSMDFTLQDGELTLVWSLGYHPKQGDIVVLNKTTAEFLGGENGEAIVKRVIATGGQTVDIDYASSTISVDGVPLNEPYLWEDMHLPFDPLMHKTHWEIPQGHVFVMGDNRNNSTDSRHEWLGPIDEHYILGRVSFALWPLEKFGPI